MKPTCAYPGCDAQLTARNRSGVCGKHIHQAPHCACVQCKGGGKTPPKGQPRTLPPKVAKITLPAAPWEVTA